MNAAPIVTVWMQLIGLLAGEVALVVGGAAFIQRFTKSAWWHRTIWQVCLLSLLALPLFELSGVARGAVGWLGRKIRFGNGRAEIAIATSPNGERVSSARLTDEFRRKVAEQFALNHRKRKRPRLRRVRRIPRPVLLPPPILNGMRFGSRHRKISPSRTQSAFCGLG